MSDNEKILMMLEALVSEVRQLDTKFETKFNELDNKFIGKFNELDTKFETKLNELDNKFQGKFDELKAEIGKLDAKTDRHLKFIIEEFERSDKRILGYLEDIALSESGVRAKASLGLL